MDCRSNNYSIMKYSELIQFEPLNEVVKFNRLSDDAYRENLVKTYVFSKAYEDTIIPEVCKNLDYTAMYDTFGLQIVGTYGTGKSHLMSLISLVAENADYLPLVQNEKAAQVLKNIAGKYRKMHIPDDPGYYEKFYFTPGDLGFKPIDTSVGRLGVLVCWDQWYPEAARLMALQGAELLIYPTAIGYDPNDSREEQERQRMAWQTVQRGHAVANGLPVVTVNRVGDEDGVPFWGTSFVAGPQGELLYEAPIDQEEVALVDIDMQRSEQVRRWWPFLRDRRIENYSDLTRRFIDK